MRELTKSIGSFTWAMSLFGAKQMLNVLRPSQASDAFDNVTRETEHQLDDTLRATFQAGDRIQRSMVDLTFGLLTLQAFDPGRWSQAASEMAGGAAEATRQAAAATGQMAGQAAADVARPRVPPPGRGPTGSPAPRQGAAGPGRGGVGGWGPMP